MKNIFAIWIVMLVAIGCSTFTPEQRETYERIHKEQEAASIQLGTDLALLAQTSDRYVQLLYKSWAEGLTPAEAQEMQGLLIVFPPSVRQMLQRIEANHRIVWEAEQEKIALREEAGGGWWEEAAIAAGTLIVGMGIPTSGPLGGLLAGLAPMLESLGVRNRRKREEYHVRAYKGPGDTVPPPPS